MGTVFVCPDFVYEVFQTFVMDHESEDLYRFYPYNRNGLFRAAVEVGLAS
jgi:hypothetical protein